MIEIELVQLAGFIVSMIAIVFGGVFTLIRYIMRSVHTLISDMEARLNSHIKTLEKSLDNYVKHDVFEARISAILESLNRTTDELSRVNQRLDRLYNRNRDE